MKSRIFVPNKGVSVDFGESKIYTISDGIYKEFKDNISLATRRRKKERLIYLSQFNNLKEYYPEIEYFVECLFGLYIKGYVMQEVQSTQLYYSGFAKEKLDILHKIKEILSLFEDIGLRYYDLHTGNVVLNKNKLPMFFDIDSILYIDETKPDIKPFGFDYYEIYGGKLDKKFQLIKFNALVQSILASVPKGHLTYDELGNEMINCQLNIYNPNSIFANEDLLEHVTLSKKRND